MEYPTTNLGSGQPGYQHPQDQPLISPGCNSQPTTTAFPAPESGPHHRTYASYQQPYQPPHEYSGIPNVHPPPNPSTYYSTESHGQSLTLNQLLQQGSTPGGYQIRSHSGPPGQAPYRSYEPFPYGYKPGVPGGVPDRPQVNAYPYVHATGHRYPDLYGRSAYPGYASGSAYSYYQNSPMPPQPQQARQMVIPQVSAADYPIPCSSSTPPRPTQPTTPAGSGLMMDRPPSRSLGLHGQSSSMSPVQLSSPVHSSIAANPALSNWPQHASSFGSPIQLSHGQMQLQQQTASRSVSRDSQQLKNSSDSCGETHASDGQLENHPANQTEDAGSRPQSRLSETGRPSTANSSNSGIREVSDDPCGQNAVDAQPVSSTDSNSAGSNVLLESQSPTLSAPNFMNMSTTSPANAASRGTPPSHQSSSGSSCASASIPSGHTVVGSPIPGVVGPQRLLGQHCQPFRPYGLSPQGSQIHRPPYPPYIQSQSPQQQPAQQQAGHYVTGGRPPSFYPGSGHPMRPTQMHTMSHSGVMLPRSSMSSSHFPSQTGVSGLGMMPPPAAPPPNASQSGPGNAGPASQMGFLSTSAYAQAGSASGVSYTAPSGAASSASWDPQSHSPHPAGAPNSISHQQHFAAGRPSSLYSGPSERPVGYSSPPQSTVPTSTGVSSQPSITGGTYPPTQIPPYHSQMPPYSGIPYHSHPYLSGVGVGGPTPSSPQSQQQQAMSMGNSGSAPPPYPVHPVPAGGTSGQPVRDHFHSSYGPMMSQPPDRGAPPTFGSSNMMADSAAFSNTAGGVVPTSIRMSNTGVTTGSKMSPCGIVKSTKMELGVRSMTPNNNVPPGASTNISFGTCAGPLDETTSSAHHLPPNHQSGVILHSGQSLQHFPSNYWPEGAAPGQFNSAMVGPQGPHGFPPFQHYRPPVPQNHPQYAHNLPNSVGGSQSGGSMYGGGGVNAPNASHLHPAAHSISSQSSSGFQKLLEMGSEPERRGWLEHYVRFMEEIGKPLVGLPQVVKQPLDLYRFYLAVRERGGVLEVIKARRWKEISQLVNINASASAAYTLRKNYCKFLLDYECRFDRGGSDPRPILSHIEAMSGKKKKPSTGDTDPGCGPITSLSGPGLQVPAPPSPAGSHSSASSSLLPPGSGSASLSGVPTAGSAASDSQHGPSTQQQRFADSNQSVNPTMLIENSNGISSSPTSSAISSGNFISGCNVSSPQRPLSTSAAVNGYGCPPHSSVEPPSRSNASWPWSSAAGPPTSGVQQSTLVAVNGFPATSSPVRGPLATHAMQGGTFDSGVRSQYGFSPSVGKMTSVHAPSSGIGTVPMSQSPVSAPAVVNASIAPPSTSVVVTVTGSTITTALFTKGTEPTVHHHASSYPPLLTPGTVCPPSVHQHSLGSQHPQSPGHPVPPHPSAPGPAHSPMHPRMCIPMGMRTPSFGSNSTGPTHPGGANDPVALLCMQQLRSSIPTQMPNYPSGVLSSFPGAPAVGASVPAHLIHHHGQRPGYVATILKRVEHYSFPPGSIEATQVESTRKRRYRSKDVGSIAPFKLLMALRSGLTAEVSWALNCLNILLRDENSIDCITPATLPGLITNLVELWRHSLGEVFNHQTFVTSLELPTDLSSITCSDLTLKHASSTSTPTPKMKYLPRSSFETSMLKSPNVLSLPNGLANLERDIIATARSCNVPLMFVRAGIRQLLRKCTDSNSNSLPLHTRNGLLFRVDQLCTVPTTTGILTGMNSVPADSVGSTNSRTRKRGKTSIPCLNYTACASSANTHGLLSTYSSPFSAFAARSESLSAWTTTRVTTAVNSFRSPEAYTNLRELALYVIEELLERDCKSKSSSDETDQNKFASRSVDTPLTVDVSSRMGLKPTSSPAKCLRELIVHGGGDTTCHIMPPFGASPFPSKHWSCEPDVNPNDTEPGFIDANAFPTPPPTVLKEKCTPKDKAIDEPNDVVEPPDEDDAQPVSKRVRHASTSSLTCPVLSPQPIDECLDDRDTHDSTPQVRPASMLETEEGTSNVSMPVDDDDMEFSHMVMDANGRCPLRAREELVYHGATCLWPDTPQTDSNEARAVRCLCVSTVLRNLSFLSLSEQQLCTHKGLLSLIGRVILLGHEHIGPTDNWQTVEKTAHTLDASLCAWRTPVWLEDMRENALVALVNVAGYVKLITFEESIVRPILEGLLHWVICPIAVSIDPFPGHRTLSPRRLALEAINRLCVHETNVDLLLSTPNSQEADLSKLFDRLAHWLALPEDQVTRELALSTMHYLTGGGMSYSNTVDGAPGKISSTDPSFTTFPTNHIGTTLLALAKPCPIAGLLAFIEAAETTTRRVIEQFGVQALQERPELMGTSLEMVRRAGALLDRLAADSTGRSRFTPNLELRLMDLVTSRVLDATVAHLLCGALHRLSCNRHSVKNITTPLVPPNPTVEVVARLLKDTNRESKEVASVDCTEPIKASDGNSIVVNPSIVSSCTSRSPTYVPGSSTFESVDGNSVDQPNNCVKEDVPDVDCYSPITNDAQPQPMLGNVFIESQQPFPSSKSLSVKKELDDTDERTLINCEPTLTVPVAEVPLVQNRITS
ncbi:hypothetical protein EG68_09438 [Paragonimus skrjabini miyazakii]|uniref:ARID domain-containing protein n=1 Tax=Paragonimus skrjabini miyazakii TaxID=59628 RepID=A0A8S9YDY4_9TREM|nr:hypothetical protein EG68_09438 [Paragonimus skrjabini miyazakii]